MTERRQAPHAGKPAVTSLFLILISFFALLSVLTPSVLTQSAVVHGAGLMALMSAITLVSWHCHRRESTSPRRVGRRI